MKISKKSLVNFFDGWIKEAIKELNGRKLTFPDDWPEDFPKESAAHFCVYFGIKQDED